MTAPLPPSKSPIDGDVADPLSPFAIGSAVWPGGLKLIEEAAELTQALAKLQAYPKGTYADGTDLVAQLWDELADLRAAIAYFRWANGAGTTRYRDVEGRVHRKIERFKAWHGGASRYESEVAE